MMKIKLVIDSLLLISNVYSQINVKEEVIENGIVYKKIINKVDTLSIDILKINIATNNYELRTVKANILLNSKETTTEMVKSLENLGYDVLAAINADFFEADGEIVNNMISDGKFVKAVKFTDSPFNPFVNSQFAITIGNKFLMEQFVFNGQLILPNGNAESIERINSTPDSNCVMLFNSFQGEKTPLAKDKWYVSEISLRPIKKSSDTLICVAKDSFHIGGQMKISNEFVLSANNKYARYLEREISYGDTLKIISGFNPNYQNIKSLVGGWPRLIRDGKNVIRNDSLTEGIIPRFSKVKHPRTGIGFSKDSSTVYFITVDGRQESSSGMTLLEFADLMIEEGIYQGLNLDGGGSTTMIINDKVVNHPSDQTGERKVGNCIMLIKK
jgi:exopolysaccharide biosynthesis protein